MTVLAVYSESGGATKTTTAVSLAMTYAKAGKDVLLVDLDPRAAASHWIGVQAKEPRLDVSAILGNDEVEGWAEQLAVPVPQTWGARSLRVVPSHRNTSVMEAGHADHQDKRLRRSLVGVQADVVVLDCPNRQGGSLTMNALYAADGVIYAAKPDADGQDGVDGARTSVHRHQRNLRELGARRIVSEVGVVVGDTTDTVVPRLERNTLDDFEQDYGDLLLKPFVPRRIIVKECRRTSAWYGNYANGEPVVRAYADLAEQITYRMENR